MPSITLLLEGSFNVKSSDFIWICKSLSHRGGQVHVKTVTCVSQNGGFWKKKFKPGVSQNTGYFIWLICFDPSNFKVTSCSKTVTRQGNGLLTYDCHQLTLFPRKINFYPKNFKMLLFGARVTEDVGDLYLFSSLALAFCYREITTESFTVAHKCKTQYICLKHNTYI